MSQLIKAGFVALDTFLKSPPAVIVGTKSLI